MLTKELVKNSIEIREITTRDYKDVIDLITKTVQISNSPDYSQKIIDYQISNHYTLEWLKTKSKGKYILLASLIDNYEQVDESKSKIVGICALKENSLTSLFIDPDYQHLGIGNIIVSKIEQECKKKGFQEIKLESSITARNFYLKLGYTIFNEEEVDWLGERVKLIQMKKELF